MLGATAPVASMVTALVSQGAEFSSTKNEILYDFNYERRNEDAAIFTFAMAGLMGGLIIGGIFRGALAPVIGRLQFTLAPLVAGLVVTMLGLSLVNVGIPYAAGGVPAIGKPRYGSLLNCSVALTVIFTVVTFGVKG